MRALVVVAVLALAVAGSAGSRTDAAGLRGHVTICRPTCAGSARHVTLLFRYVFKISNATTDGSGNYHISLGPAATPSIRTAARFGQPSSRSPRAASERSTSHCAEPANGVLEVEPL